MTTPIVAPLDGDPTDPDWAGLVTDAANQVGQVLAPGWTDYSSTFTLTAATTNPTKGNSTYTARYRRATGSDLILVEIYILIGSTFSVGSGQYYALLPVNASAGSILSSVGSCYVLDVGVAKRHGATTLFDATRMQFNRDGDSVFFTSGVPQSWATGDVIAASIQYEPAS